jgi:hypothetical protein
MKYFNIAGPCNKTEHYMIEASSRLQGVEQLIDMAQYFVIHAARQSGKTTYLLDLTRKLHVAGKYYAVYCSLETLQGVTDSKEGIPLVIACLKKALRTGKIPQNELFAVNADYNNYTGVLHEALTDYCEVLDKPLVIFFDEADCLTESTLISFLRQLRLGYVTRSLAPFVHSVGLIGMRNIRDYKAQVRPDSQSLGSASPFNIVTETMTLKNFTKEEITSLYKQHTDDAGQVFEDEAIDLINEQTQGQPWLVNAIVREVIVEILHSDYSQTVTAEQCNTAIQTIILRRDTHIDSLLERLKEDRVRRVIEPMINGNPVETRLSDDYQYVVDLGLIKSVNAKIQPSNPIYGEVIVRTLSYDAQQDIINEKPDYIIPRYLKSGTIDVNFLLSDFQQFWRENSAIWIEKTQYKEAAPHLILQGFLQRVLNGGGQIIRDMGAGTGRLDLCVVYEDKKYPIEIKLWKGDQYYQKGLEQIARYMDTLGCKEGWMVIFDQRSDKSWEEKIYYKQELVSGFPIHVFGN